MKGFGLLLAIGIGCVAVYLKENHGYSDTAFGLVLAFGLIVGGVIAFYGRILKVKFFNAEVELAEKRIDEATEKAVAKLREEVDRLKSGLPGVLLGDDGCCYLGPVHQDEDGRRYIEDTDKGETKRIYDRTNGNERAGTAL